MVLINKGTISLIGQPDTLIAEMAVLFAAFYEKDIADVKIICKLAKKTKELYDQTKGEEND